GPGRWFSTFPCQVQPLPFRQTLTSWSEMHWNMTPRCLVLIRRDSRTTDYAPCAYRIESRKKPLTKLCDHLAKKSCTKYGCAAEGEGIDVAIVMLQAITL